MQVRSLKIPLNINSLKELISQYLINSKSFKTTTKLFGYYKTIDTSLYNIYQLSPLGTKVIAAYENMVIVQNRFCKKKLIVYPSFTNRYLRFKIIFNDKYLPGLLPGSNLSTCMILPYMRKICKGKFVKSKRIVIITDRAQIFHNYPARDTVYEGASWMGDIVRFEESVIWDKPGRKYPSPNKQCLDTEVYFPNLPHDCYKYHPYLNTDSLFKDIFNNGGFPQNTYINNGKESVKVSRFYIPERIPESNPFHFIGTGCKDYKMTVIGTYRSNREKGVRTCLFATSDGGRQWYCKYEFSDLGYYDFKQGNPETFGHNFGNPIYNDKYNNDFVGGVCVYKRNLLVPSDLNKEPDKLISWDFVGEIKTILDRNILTLSFDKQHNLSTGNIISLCKNKGKSNRLDWMINNTIGLNTSGNNILFKVNVIDTNTIELYELVSSPDYSLPCRHIHHINRVKDGWLIGTGEIYPNGWLLYMQMKEADTYSIKEASDYFEIIRLNSSENSVQRTMGAVFAYGNDNTILYASDHDLLPSANITISNNRTQKYSRNTIGIFKSELKNIDNRLTHELVCEFLEPSYYFQYLDSMLVFGGQRGEFAISFDNGKNWHKERLNSTIMHFLGNNNQLYYFDKCIIYRK